MVASIGRPTQEKKEALVKSSTAPLQSPGSLYHRQKLAPNLPGPVASLLCLEEFSDNFTLALLQIIHVLHTRVATKNHQLRCGVHGISCVVLGSTWLNILSTSIIREGFPTISQRRERWSTPTTCRPMTHTIQFLANIGWYTSHLKVRIAHISLTTCMLCERAKQICHCCTPKYHFQLRFYHPLSSFYHSHPFYHSPSHFTTW